MGLYAFRKALLLKAARPLRPLLGLLRVIAGIVLPLGLLGHPSAPAGRWRPGVPSCWATS